jgi:hypothetical protein
MSHVRSCFSSTVRRKRRFVHTPKIPTVQTGLVEPEQTCTTSISAHLDTHPLSNKPASFPRTRSTHSTSFSNSIGSHSRTSSNSNSTKSTSSNSNSTKPIKRCYYRPLNTKKLTKRLNVQTAFLGDVILIRQRFVEPTRIQRNYVISL